MKVAEEANLSHLAIIMDGNGRWAKQNEKHIKDGHKSGAEKLSEVCNWAIEFGIEQLTVYAFSTENWGRDKKEVNDILDLLEKYLSTERKTFQKNKIKLKVIGSLDKLKKSTISKINEIEKETKNNSSLLLNIAFSYSGQQEIVDATKKISQDILNEKISIDDIDIDLLTKYSYNSYDSYPDLVLRTGAKDRQRVSNFLLWHIAYSELSFINTLWPDFSKSELLNEITKFKNIERNYGKRKS